MKIQINLFYLRRLALNQFLWVRMIFSKVKVFLVFMYNVIDELAEVFHFLLIHPALKTDEMDRLH